MLKQNTTEFNTQSNLIKPSKSSGASIYSRHQGRVRGPVFTQMFHNLKGTLFVRESNSNKQPQFQSIKKKNKQNIGIQVNKLISIKTPQALSALHQIKNRGIYSRSFVIRSHSKRDETATVPIPDKILTFTELTIYSRGYNFGKAQKLCRSFSYLERTRSSQMDPLNLAIFLPVSILKKQLSYYSGLVSNFLQSRIQIFLISVSKQEKQNLQKFNSLQQKCHIICLQAQQSDVLCFLNLQCIQNLPQNLLFIESLDFPFSRIFPYLSSIKNRYIRYSFLKVRDLQKIQAIRLISSTEIIITVKSEGDKQQMGLKLEKFDLPLHVKLELEWHQRRKEKRKTRLLKSSNIIEPKTDPNLENLQEKLLQYVKIVKDQMGWKPAPSRKNIQKETSKCPFKIIEELIAKNVAINKQIQEFIQGAKQVRMRDKDPYCDPIQYYLLD